MIIKINPTKILKILLLIIIFLILASTAVQISKYLFSHSNVFGLYRLFSLDDEGNVPTWYSSITLFVCSLLLAIIAYSKKKEKDLYLLHWSLLSIIFIFLSIDESACIHELVMIHIKSYIDLSGIFYFSWVIIGIPLVLIFIVLFRKFVIDLPIKNRFQFILSGILFLSGALGMELIDGWYLASIDGTVNFTYMMLTTLEETLEMVGSAVFIYSLLIYIKSISIRVNTKELIIKTVEENTYPTQRNLTS